MPPSWPRAFVPGSPRQVMRRPLFLSVWRSVFECAAAGSPPRPIYSDFLFRRRRKTGRRTAKSATTVCSTHCAARSALHANTAAAKILRRRTCSPSSSAQRIHVCSFRVQRRKSRAAEARAIYSYLAFSLRGRGIDEEMFPHVLGEADRPRSGLARKILYEYQDKHTLRCKRLKL